MNRGIKLLILFGVLMMASLVIITVFNKDSKTGPELPDAKPPEDALEVVRNYTRARENSVGANRTTTDSWVEDVREISTPEWLEELTPKKQGTTGDASAEFDLAHIHNLVVDVELNKCIWNFKFQLPTEDVGVVYCELMDVTKRKDTETIVQGEALPFGWTHTGAQLPINIKLKRVDNKWLVEEDLTHSDPD